jgi:hypothetical protein
MPAIDTRFFWERDFSIDEGFGFKRGQPANRGLRMHVLETIDPSLIPQHVQSGLRTLDMVRFSLISRCTHRARAAFQLVEKFELSLQSIIGGVNAPKCWG